MFKTNKSLRFRSERAVNYQRRGNLETPYKELSLVIHEQRVMKGKRSYDKGRERASQPKVLGNHDLKTTIQDERGRTTKDQRNLTS